MPAGPVPSFRQTAKNKREADASLLLRGKLQLLLQLGAAAHAAAQVVELRAADLTAADDLDVVDGGRMDGEDLLHADAVGQAADGDGLLDAAVLLGDDGALEDGYARGSLP